MSINPIPWLPANDKHLIKEVGAAIQRMRVQADLTQEHVAENSGLDRSTIAKLEGGRAATLLTIIKVLRAIGRLDTLEPFLRKPEPTPYMLMEQESLYRKSQRKRASGKPKVILPPKPKSTW